MSPSWREYAPMTSASKSWTVTKYLLESFVTVVCDKTRDALIVTKFAAIVNK